MMWVIGVSSFSVCNDIKFILKAAEREALEKAQERELRRQKEELMNGKVRLVVSLLLFSWLDFVLVWLVLYKKMDRDNKNHFSRFV